MVPSTVAMLLVGPLAGPLQARFGSRLPLIFGCGFAALGFAMLAVAHSRPIEVYVAAGLLGIGIGLAFAAMANLIVEAVPPDQTGVATGVNTITRTIGGAFGGQIVATIISGGGSPTESSFALAFAVIAGSLVLSIVAALAIPKPGRGKREPVAPGAAIAEVRG
jgi:MFS family permease